MPLLFPFETPPESGRLREVAPDVFWLRQPLPYQLDHVNLWLLRDGAGWAIVDTGFPGKEAMRIWSDILGSLNAPVTRLIVTHFHPDHLGLANYLLEKTGASLWMSSSEFLTAHALWHGVGGHSVDDMVAQFRQHGLDDAQLAGFLQRGNLYRNIVRALPQHYNRLKLGDTLTINGKTWQLYVGDGHSPEHLSLYCSELDVLISGDMLLPKISTHIAVFAATPKADVLTGYLESIEKFAQEIPDTALVLPSHGLPFQGIHERVDALKTHHAERLQRLEIACKTPQTAADVLETLFQRPLDSHQLLFAMGEAIAHLNHMECAGRLTPQTDENGVIRFSST